MDPSNKFPGLIRALPIEPLFEALPPEKRRLGLFLVMAAILHITIFSFLRISYPEPTLKSSPRVHVTLLNPTALQSSARTHLDFWYSIQDPSLLIRPQGELVPSAPIDLSPAKQISRSPQRLALVSSREDLTFLPDGLPPLSERANGMLDTPRQAFTYPALSTAAKADTAFTFDPVLAGRLKSAIPTLPVQTSGLLPESGVTILRIGVESDGRVSHVLVDQSSGRNKVDAVALQAARKLHFEAAPKTGLVWGQVTVFWQFEPEAPAATVPPTATNAQP